MVTSILTKATMIMSLSTTIQLIADSTQLEVCLRYWAKENRMDVESVATHSIFNLWTLTNKF